MYMPKDMATKCEGVPMHFMHVIEMTRSRRGIRGILGMPVGTLVTPWIQAADILNLLIA